MTLIDIYHGARNEINAFKDHDLPADNWKIIFNNIDFDSWVNLSLVTHLTHRGLYLD